MTGQSFEDLYSLAVSSHPKGLVSVESFRNLLDQMLANTQNA